MEKVELVIVILSLGILISLTLFAMLRRVMVKQNKLDISAKLDSVKSQLQTNSNSNDSICVRLMEIERKHSELANHFNDLKQQLEQTIHYIERNEEEIKENAEQDASNTGITENDIFKEMRKHLPTITKELYDTQNTQHKKERKNAYKRLYRKLKK